MRTFYYVCVSHHKCQKKYIYIYDQIILSFGQNKSRLASMPVLGHTDQQMEAKTSMWCAHQPKSSVFKLSADLNLVKKKLNGLILCKAFFFKVSSKSLKLLTLLLGNLFKQFNSKFVV